jgi:hypothetical protein
MVLIYFTHQNPDGGDGVSFLKAGLLNHCLQLPVRERILLKASSLKRQALLNGVGWLNMLQYCTHLTPVPSQWGKDNSKE